MDLTSVVQSMLLDQLAEQADSALSDAGVPHVLLKGPSTATWLYDESRPYRDVDLLVPARSLVAAARSLADADVAHPSAGTAGEEAAHSQLLINVRGWELDLHGTLPLLTAPAYINDDRVWRAIERHIVRETYLDRPIPVLDHAGRCLVIALHAVADFDGSQAREDLLRAWQRAGSHDWRVARQLAVELGATELFASAIALVDDTGAATASVPFVELKKMHAVNAAFALERLADLPWHRRPGWLWRELVPSRGFMLHQSRRTTMTRRELAEAHVSRWSRLGRQLPAAIRQRRAAHHQ